MLKGFEDLYKKVDAEIDESDTPNVSLIVSGLQNKIGKDKAITNKQMREALKKRGINLHPIKMRKIIQYIRVHNMVPMLCASSKGYYRAETEEEFFSWLDSAEQRASMQLFTVHCQKFFNTQQEKL